MIRIEIIAAQAVQQDVLEMLTREQIIPCYTVVPEVQGKGFSGSKIGDSVWPEKNFIFIAYCTEKEARQAKQIVTKLKKRFSTEGIAMFATSVQELS